MTEIHAQEHVAGPAPARQGERRTYLHSPLIDFLCLGGGSVPVLIAAVLLLGQEHQAAVLITISVLAIFVNNPHFMASYQIFYDRFAEKLADRSSGLRHRYLISGILVPAVLIAYFATSVIAADPGMIGRAINVMFFLVGWHYVKQGYGVLIVESVLHRTFFSETEKTVLRWNGLAAWIFSWVYGNRLIETSAFQGFEYVTLGVPIEAAWVTGAMAAAAGAAALTVLVRRAAAGQLPLNGTCGYLAAVYLWMALAYFNPMFLLLGPVFHSLQYLAVVSRYQLNKAEAEQGEGRVALLNGLLDVSTGQAGLIRFAFIGVIAGSLAFVVVPVLLDWAIAYREELFGPSMFLVMFVVFINIHHYFLDNVMWRKGNPDVRANLFR